MERYVGWAERRISYSQDYHNPTWNCQIMKFRIFLFQIKIMLLESVGNLAAVLQELIGCYPKIILSSRGALAEWKYVLKQRTKSTKGKIIIAAIRNRRWVEWGVFSACVLAYRGYEPVVVFSSSEIKSIYTSIAHRIFGFWQAALQLPFNFTDLDGYIKKDSFSDMDDKYYHEMSEKEAHMMAAYDLKIEEYEPDPQDVEEYHARVTQARSFVKTNALALDRFIGDQGKWRMIVPSGLIGLSVAFRLVAQRKQMTCMFVESWDMRPGHNIWSLDRPALELDLDGWLSALGPWTEARDLEMRQFMAFREGADPGSLEKQDKWLDNFHQVQNTSKTETLPVEVQTFLSRPGPKYMLGTNVVGDSATLRRATIFRSQREWIRCVIDFFKIHPEFNLVIRIHPDEDWKNAYQRMGAVANDASRGIPNIYVINSMDRVNTFSLLDHIDVCLAWVSNFGLDCALRGKPVVLAARAPYAALGLCHVPGSRQSYFDLLFHLAKNPALPENVNFDLGKAYHYILFKKRSLLSDSPRYLARDYRLLPPMHPETDVFYQIMAGEIPDKGDYGLSGS